MFTRRSSRWFRGRGTAWHSSCSIKATTMTTTADMFVRNKSGVSINAAKNLDTSLREQTNYNHTKFQYQRYGMNIRRKELSSDVFKAYNLTSLSIRFHWLQYDLASSPTSICSVKMSVTLWFKGCFGILWIQWTHLVCWQYWMVNSSPRQETESNEKFGNTRPK